MPSSLFPQIIGLLDVFTPSRSLSEFSDVYLVTHLMGADLNNIVKTQKLSDDHVQFLVYQVREQNVSPLNRNLEQNYQMPRVLNWKLFIPPRSSVA